MKNNLIGCAIILGTAILVGLSVGYELVKFMAWYRVAFG